jgi:hypothetical protein
LKDVMNPDKIVNEYSLPFESSFSTKVAQEIIVCFRLPYNCLAMRPKHLVIDDFEGWVINSLTIGSKIQNLKKDWDTIQTGMEISIIATPQKSNLILRGKLIGKAVMV